MSVFPLILDGFGSPKPSQNKVRDAPKYQQGTPGAPPECVQSHEGIQNSISNGLGSIWDRFGVDLGTEMGLKISTFSENVRCRIFCIRPKKKKS